MKDKGAAYTKPELAKYLNVTPRTIANWAKRKRNPIPHEKVPINNSSSWKYVFYENPIREWLTGQTKGAKTND